ncbi:MAG: hypothetical protein K2P39_02525, partial [Lachnospiraceae bacterium]|nr:hypothetical protein [Lachnospiraceae bacterium]
PRQIGLGVKTAAINTTITQEGANQSTGNPFDLKLTGEAFFVVSDGTSTYYTRDGSLDVDDAGNLVMASTGYIVQGWGVDENGNIVQGSLGGINVTTLDTFGADATKNAKINGILDAQDSELENKTGRTVTVGPIYDKAGYQYNAKFGILPVTEPITESRNITNNEYEYTPKSPIYQVDLSTFKYKYDNNTKELKASDMPAELLEKLEKAIWNEVNHVTYTPPATAPAGITVINDTIGDKGERVEVDLGAFIAGDPDLEAAILKDSNLRLMQDLKVEFSGGIGFTNEKPTYPIGDMSVVKVDPNVVTSLGYTAGANGEYTIATASITAIKQVFADGDESRTEYVFKAGGNPLNIDPDLAAAAMKILGLGTMVKQNTYTTSEDKTTDQIRPKE